MSVKCSACVKSKLAHVCVKHASCVSKPSYAYDPDQCSTCTNWYEEAQNSDNTAVAVQNLQKWFNTMRNVRNKNKSSSNNPDPDIHWVSARLHYHESSSVYNHQEIH